MILLIDNYDSFTYNLYQYLSELGETVEVVRNDKITTDEIAQMAPDSLVISPGPGGRIHAGRSEHRARQNGGAEPMRPVPLPENG